jgi:hypothetical protein
VSWLKSKSRKIKLLKSPISDCKSTKMIKSGLGQLANRPVTHIFLIDPYRDGAS